ncbi:hypothetical protein FB565_004222 [Actinoplanes lutulentus]|uniref:Uncharacterized protein n=1 Tax=Actinoplanes lutulentus TaxID=1287878 RepID=A0A327ZJ82_9ACTN|nr:hypothetical protein [Actinoplanes lutulentus]MBB2944493.1 hypothetical protein [Actinoplanes lutulentus]RAK42275.1 hypothetical protein B0I29_102100 [Actinoplanes lutulentus]
MATVRERWSSYSERARRRAWLQHLSGYIVITALVLSMIVARIVAGFVSPETTVLNILIFAVLSVSSFSWWNFTRRLLRNSVSTLIGVLIFIGIPLASYTDGGPDSALVLTGRTATCTVVAVEQLPEPVWGNHWRYRLRCPDGAEPQVLRDDPDDQAMSGPLVYHPADLVPARPLVEFEDDTSTAKRWVFQALLAAFLLQTTAALTTGVTRWLFTTAEPSPPPEN